MTTTTAILTELNSYDGDNIWEDVVHRIAGYDHEATEALDRWGRSDVIALEDGTILHWDEPTRRWFAQKAAGEAVQYDIKLEYRDGATLRQRWLTPAELAEWPELSRDSQLVLGSERPGERHATVVAHDPRAEGHLVLYTEGASTYWVGDLTLAEAVRFAERVLSEGAAAYKEQ